MRRIWTALRIFFAALFHAEVATEVAGLLDRCRAATPQPAAEPTAKKPSPPAPLPKGEGRKPTAPVRSEAITLLATLQREARFVDFIKEPLESFSDAQIGAAARDVHRDCGQVIERLFSLRPIVESEEGSEIEVPADDLREEAGRYRLTGNVTGEPPFHGRLRHHGWEAGKCELPTWSGTAAAAKTIAPVEVEL